MDRGQPMGLVVDWGGVLTNALGEAFGAWAAAEGVDYDRYVATMRAWVEGAAADPAGSPVHALERGEMSVADFEQVMANALRDNGSDVVAEGLLTRMFKGLEHVDAAMTGVVARAHAQGVRTALLSNSWGNDYPREGWDELFDVVVISGEVGMRKPEHRIYHHTLDLLDLPAPQAVMVDDLPSNVAAAREVGMAAVRHVDVATTRGELEEILALDLAADGPAGRST